jgi:hypothetical protein
VDIAIEYALRTLCKERKECGTRKIKVEPNSDRKVGHPRTRWVLA